MGVRSYVRTFYYERVEVSKNLIVIGADCIFEEYIRFNIIYIMRILDGQAFHWILRPIGSLRLRLNSSYSPNDNKRHGTNDESPI